MATTEISTDGPLVPLWDATDLDAAFGGGVNWPKWNDPRLSSVPHKFVDIANSLSFRGGRLGDHGLKLKADVDAKQFSRCLRAVLGSFKPPHEVKEAVAGSLLQHYCEPA